MFNDVIHYTGEKLDFFLRSFVLLMYNTAEKGVSIFRSLILNIYPNLAIRCSYIFNCYLWHYFINSSCARSAYLLIKSICLHKQKTIQHVLVANDTYYILYWSKYVISPSNIYIYILNIQLFFIMLPWS